MLVGHGCELVRETLSVGLDSWTFFAQPHPLLRIISEGPVCLHERLVQLLALEVQVTGRSYHAQDHEGVPHESIRTSACLKSQFSYTDSPRSGKSSDRVV